MQTASYVMFPNHLRHLTIRGADSGWREFREHVKIYLSLNVLNIVISFTTHKPILEVLEDINKKSRREIENKH